MKQSSTNSRSGFKISWSHKAENQFDKIITYLEKEFGNITTSEFVRKVFDVLSVISIFPEIGSIENRKYRIRGLIINKHVTLFYQVRKNRIIILNLFDNRQNPENKYI